MVAHACDVAEADILPAGARVEFSTDSIEEEVMLQERRRRSG